MADRLLLVDGDPKTLRVLDVTLRGAGFAVETATDGTAAWSRIESAPPDLIIADTNLAGMDGFELCRRVRRNSAASAIPFIFLSEDRTTESKILGLEAGADDYLVKPAYVQEVIARVRSAFQRRDRERLNRSNDPPGGPAGDGKVAPRFAGRLSDITVVDLVQLIEGNGRSGIAYLRGAAGAPASIYFRHGKVVDAAVGQLSGIAALSRLFSWTDGHFEIEWKSIRRKDAIEQPPGALVIEGMRRLDAWNGLLGQLSDPNAVFEVDFRLLAERLAEIPDEINGILRLCDGVRTTMEVVEDSSMSDIDALSALIRLCEEGILRDSSVGRPLSGAGGAAPPQALWLGQPSGAIGPSPTGRTAIGADPVEQSFADRLEEEARGGGSPQRHPLSDPKPERLSSSPRSTTTSESPPPESGVEHRADQVQQLQRQQERQQEGQDNVIKFPALTAETGFGPAASGVAGSPDATLVSQDAPDASHLALAVPGLKTVVLGPSGAATKSDKTPPHVGDGEFPIAPGPDSAQGEPAPPQAAPRSPASMADTHRGFGPRHTFDVRRDSAVPIEVVDRHSSRASQQSAGLEGPEASSPMQPEAARPHIASEPAARQTAGAGPPPPQTGDQTVRVSFSDNDISRRDALDELGLAPKWRGFRFVGMALVIAVLCAVGVQLVRAGRATTEPAPATNPEGPGATDARLAINPVAPVAGTLDRDAVAADGVSSAPVANAPAATIDSAAVATAPKPTTPIGAAPSPAAAVQLPEVAPTAAGEASPATSAPPPPASPVAERTQGAGPVPTGSAASNFSRQMANCRGAFARSRWRDALTSCGAALTANPGSAEALTLLAHTELNRGRLARAGELASRAAAIDPNLADAYVIIGGVNQDSGKNREAKAAYRRYLELAPRGRYADELRSIINSL
jgi:CheY-like chemotaxis protein